MFTIELITNLNRTLYGLLKEAKEINIAAIFHPI